MKKVGLTEGKALFQHIRPRKIKGNIRFGFENPANTGEVLGILGIIYPVLPRKLTIIPDFNQSVLEGSLEARGRVYGIFFLIRYFLYGISVEGWTSLMLVLLAFFGITLLSIGIMGIYLMNILNESKKMPHYVIRRKDV